MDFIGPTDTLKDNDSAPNLSSQLSMGAKNFRQPIVCIHGLGIGLFFNLQFFFSCVGDRETFIIEIPWVSQNLMETIPTPNEFVETIEFIFSRHGLWR